MSGDGALSAGKQARRLLDDGERLLAAANALLAEESAARKAVRQAVGPVVEALVRAELGRIPVARLRDVSEGRLHVEALEEGGFATVWDVLDAPAYRLRAVPGIGARSAAQLLAAAGQLADAARETVAVRLDVDEPDSASTAVVQALHPLACAGPDLPAACERARALAAALTAKLAAARPARGRIRMLLAGQRREEARDALAAVHEIVTRENAAETGLLFAQVTADLLRTATAVEAWVGFESAAAEYYGLLVEALAFTPDPEAVHGFVSADIVKKVNALRLDETHRRVALRGYQTFGAKFALTQARVIIGDEMGLGKSIEAIAVLAHLRAQGHTHFLVTCPASVLVNWMREIEARSTLPVHRLHGPGRYDALDAWCLDGGVAVTTIDTLHALRVPDALKVAAFVLDEAHFAKNPAARRSQAVAAWCRRVDRVLFLTGTPMENRMGEFRALVSMLRPHLLDRVYPGTGPEEFRRAVAPVYLRRNQKDVLTELPDVVRVDEWTEFSTADLGHYRTAVAQGSFTAMRGAAYADPGASAKLVRIREIVRDAEQNNHKVVVFSSFLATLDAVGSALGPAVVGTIAGNVPAARRQDIIDEFSATVGHGVLLGQIQAAGFGVNLQAASVVILCEPQLKPTLESQAIARAQRMGQLRTVRAHRILTHDSVDQRILDILQRKTHLFDTYVRHSEVAESAPEAVDATDASLARQIVEEEQLRYARSA